MPNLMTYLVPDPLLPAIDYTLTPVPFKAQFVAPPAAPGGPPPTTPLPAPTSPLVIATALDCGYGNSAADLLNVTAAQWNDLCAYLTTRWTSMIATFHQDPATAEWRRAGFVAYLESNDKNPIAFTMGSAYCRIGVQEWMSANGKGALQRFWHYKVLRDKAVVMTPVANPAFAASDNADYLIQDSANDWLMADAKGSTRTLSNSGIWTPLKTGLMQAHKFTSLSFALPVAPAAPVLAPISGQVCVLTYFAGPNATLESIHLDPPADGGGNDGGADEDNSGPGARPGPLLFLEAGDLVRFAEALAQFQACTALPTLPEGPPDAAAPYYWGYLFGQQKQVVGVAAILLRHRTALHWTLEMLRSFIPVLAQMRVRQRPDDMAADRQAWQALAATARRQANDPARASSAAARAWQDLAAAMHGFAAEAQAPRWDAVFTHLWSAGLLAAFDDGDADFSVSRLWKILRRGIEANYLSLSLPLSDEARKGLARTSHGLVVRDNPLPSGLPG